jgi:hypothetical protein
MDEDEKEFYMTRVFRCLLLLLITAGVSAQISKPEQDQKISVVGYLRDSACVHRFHEVTKPLPNGCLQECVRAGSPLVILTRKDEVYALISAQIPETNIRQRLLPFAGKLVKVEGHLYERGGSKAISVEKIKQIPD